MYHNTVIFLLVSASGGVLKSPMRTHGIVLLPLLLALATPPIFAAPDIPESHRIGGWAIGCQAYSFNRFTAFEAIEKTAEAGGRVIEFYPGQRLSSERPDVRLDPGLSDEDIAALKARLSRHNILAVAFGVVDLPADEAGSRRVFAFAKKLGIATLTTEPSPRALDVIERLIREYDINVAIHNHPRRPNDPGYRLWDPRYVLSLVQNRDRRLGACADTGHWVRSGIRPVEALRILRGRVISSHLKDLSVFAPDGHDVPFGAGVSDIPGILDELKRQNFRGNLSIEYEHDWEGSVPEIAQCIGFVRGYAASPEKKTAATQPVSPEELRSFRRELWGVLHRGSSLARGLRVLAERQQNRRFGEAIADLSVQVERGSSLSRAMARHPDVFGESEIRAIREGEATGMLEATLRR